MIQSILSMLVSYLLGMSVLLIMDCVVYYHLLKNPKYSYYKFFFPIYIIVKTVEMLIGSGVGYMDDRIIFSFSPIFTLQVIVVTIMYLLIVFFIRQLIDKYRKKI